MERFRVLARHKWVQGATITELISSGGTLRKFVATIRGFRDWPILLCPSVDACSWAHLVAGHVRNLRDRIDNGDEAVFHEDSQLSPENAQAAKGFKP